MKHMSLIAAFLLCATAFGQQPAQPKERAQAPAQSKEQSPTPAQSKPCVIVQHEGGHAFRNVMLLGVAGAVISKERYKVVESNVAGLTAGEKMHGDELQVRTQGAKVLTLRLQDPAEYRGKKSAKAWRAEVEKNNQAKLQEARENCSK